MIKYASGKDIFRDDADALTNTVNCKGVMGKGLALAFSKRFPDIVKPYERSCESGELKPGEPFFLPRTSRRPGILLFPTKDHWRGASRLEWIDAGLRRVAERYVEWGIRSIAMPQLGCGLGGLDWRDVRPLIEKHLGGVELDVRLYGPPEPRSEHRPPAPALREDPRPAKETPSMAEFQPIPKECKRLAEVDFPIAAVSAHAARDKASPSGHPNMLHLWWARRPLMACRSMLMALLLPDPCDPRCPTAFKHAARRILLDFGSRPGRWDKELDPNNGHAADKAMRKVLLHEFIADFADWDNAASSAYLQTARSLVRAAHGDETPLVVDPFAGGGSIPFEALRVGCEVFASDVNNVASLILKVLLDDIHRSDNDFANDLRQIGSQIKESIARDLVAYFPPDSDGAQPIAYIWSRTVRCESPKCGVEIPIFRSAWLAKPTSGSAPFMEESVEGDSAAVLIESAPLGGPLKLRVARGWARECSGQNTARLKATKAAGNNANVVCPCCNAVVSGRKKEARTQAQLSLQQGGTDVKFDEAGHRVGGASLIAVVTRTKGLRGCTYRSPVSQDYLAVFKAAEALRELQTQNLESGIPLIPNEPLPPVGTLGFRVQRYGMKRWSDLFNCRQKVVLATIAKAIDAIGRSNPSLRRSLACAFSRVAMSDMSCTRWNAIAQKMQHTFGRQALPIVWDYAEVVPIADAPGNWESGYSLVAEVIERTPRAANVGQTQIADASESPLSSESAHVWFTDPPYYNAVPYSDLSDFFFVWLKRVLSGDSLSRDPFDLANPLTQKDREAVQDETKHPGGHPKDKNFFEATMARAFTEGRRVLRPDGVGCVVFAHKTTEGWEALLAGMVRGGWVITASWPIITEMGSRLRARESAALATSVHLVCRPREDGARVGDWGEIVRELPKRIGDWMERLGGEGIRGADLVFACIGPALELFSKYARVETPDGEEVGLAANDNARGEPARRGFLSYVWEHAGRAALGQVLGTAEARARNGAAGALEEDARLTALFLWTLQATEAAATGKAAKKAAEAEDDEADDADEGDEEGEETGGKKGKKKAGLSLIYDVARRFAQPLGIHLDVWEGRIIETSKGIVRLLPVAERAKQLFGEEGSSAVVRRFESSKKPDPQGMLDFMAEQRAAIPEVKGRGRKKKAAAGADASPESLKAKREATTLDRVHAAMLLQSSGATNALRALLEAERDRGPDFLRLANALTALYPRDSEEKRLLDAMLLAVPR